MYLQSCIIEIALSIFLYDPDLLLRETVEVIDQAVDPAVGGVDLALEVGLFVVRPGGGELPMEGEHLFDQGDHPVVALPVRRVGEVDGADGKLDDELLVRCEISAAEGCARRSSRTNSAIGC